MNISEKIQGFEQQMEALSEEDQVRIKLAALGCRLDMSPEEFEEEMAAMAEYYGEEDIVKDDDLGLAEMAEPALCYVCHNPLSIREDTICNICRREEVKKMEYCDELCNCCGRAVTRSEAWVSESGDTLLCESCHTEFVAATSN